MRRLVLAVALLAACGDDGSSGPIPIEDLDSTLVNAACGLYVNCGLIEDAATCRSLDLDIGFLDPSLRAAVDAGKVIYHGDKARECLGSLPASCDRTDFERSDDSACDAIFEGTVAGGGQCAMDEECISQQCNVPGCPDACCQGTCVGDAPPVLPMVGQSCAMTFQCQDGFCDGQTQTCVAYRQLGEACTGSGQCGQGGCINNVCTRLAGPGEACNPVSTSGAQCADLGYTCSTATSTCKPYGLTGDPCLNERECSPLYECNASQVCQLRSTRGDVCDPQSFGCIDRSYCDATTLTCNEPKADGAACMEDEECSGDCDFDTNTCVTPPICI